MTNTQLTLQQEVNRLVRRIRQYCCSQVSTWRLIPALALDANGRTGFSDTLLQAFSNRLWALECSTDHGYYCAFVDLDTGQILAGHDTSKLADPKTVLLIGSHLAEIDAAAIVASLQVEIQKPILKTLRTYTPQEKGTYRRGLTKAVYRGPMDA